MCHVDGAHVFVGFREESSCLEPEHAACWGDGGAFPGVAKVHCACLVVEIAEAAHEGITEAT